MTYTRSTKDIHNKYKIIYKRSMHFPSSQLAECEIIGLHIFWDIAV